MDTKAKAGFGCAVWYVQTKREETTSVQTVPAYTVRTLPYLSYGTYDFSEEEKKDTYRKVNNMLKGAI